MGDKTKIEWTDATWNPVTGCTKVSQGCKNCYAERVFPRAYGKARILDPLDKSFPRSPRQRYFTDVQTHPDRLDQPLRWKKPRRIFVNSMSDLFHEAVPFEFVIAVFNVMRRAPQHTFQILTKRPNRMRDFCQRVRFDGKGEGRMWLDDSADKVTGYCLMGGHGCTGMTWVHLGVSCENQATADERIPLLLQTPAAVRFVSLEPLLGPIKIFDELLKPCGNCDEAKTLCLATRQEMPGVHCCVECQHDVGLDWVIVGGESGPNARPIHPDWARSLRDQCQAAGVPFFFKQWGEWAPKMFYVESGKGKNYDFGVLDESGNWLTTPWNGKEGEQNGVNECTMLRVGKKAAGAMLDGREWKEFPE